MDTPTEMEGDLDQQASLSKQDIKTKLDISGAGAWLDAHHDPVASLHTFTNCIGKSRTLRYINIIYIYTLYNYYIIHTCLIFIVQILKIWMETENSK